MGCYLKEIKNPLKNFQLKWIKEFLESFLNENKKSIILMTESYKLIMI